MPLVISGEKEVYHVWIKKATNDFILLKNKID